MVQLQPATKMPMAIRLAQQLLIGDKTNKKQNQLK
jgi:lipase chaperone LimK